MHAECSEGVLPHSIFYSDRTLWVKDVEIPGDKEIRKLIHLTELILSLRLANERRRNKVTPSLNDWVPT